jgi:hypothetical protein
MAVSVSTNKLRYVLTLAILFSTCVSANTFADVNSATNNQSTGSGVVLSPISQQVDLSPGLLNANLHFTIKNNTSYNLHATMKVVDFKSIDENGGITLGLVGIPLWKYGLAKWMSLPAGNELSLAAGQSTVIQLNIVNSPAVSPGGHYGALVVTNNVQGKVSGNTNVNLSQNLVSLIYAKKVGGDRFGIQLNSLMSDAGLELPKSATLNFKSTGNVYIVPRGYIIVSDSKGHEVEKGIINTDSDLIMQGSSQNIISLLQPLSGPAVPGRYKLTAYYRYEGQSNYSEKTIYFSVGRVRPLYILATGLVIILGVISFIYRKRRKRLLWTHDKRKHS